LAALADADIRHRFEIYNDNNELVGYLHHQWPLGQMNLRRVFKYRLKTLLIFVTLFAIALAAYIYSDAIPGTYHKNEHGFPRGTGVAEYRYDDGSLMIREWYFRGLIYRSTWFTPDGRELVTETYDKATGGAGYYLRQDGTIRSKYIYEYMPELNAYGNAGNPVYYDATGTPIPGATEPID